MTREDIFQAIGEADEERVAAAGRRMERKRLPIMARWGLLAACLGLLLLPLSRLAQYKGSPTDNEVVAMAGMLYNGAYYEVCALPEVLTRYGIPARLTEDMVGERLTYLESDSAGYAQSEQATDKALYQYAPAPCRGVYVVRDGESYMAAIFCNVDQPDSCASSPLAEIYAVYGVRDAGDIVAIAQVDWHRDRVTGEMVTDEQAIRAFYQLTTALASYGNDDFQAMQFGGLTEEDQMAAHTRLADDLIVLRVETAAGLRFYLDVFPHEGWLESGGLLSYYRLGDDMAQWLVQQMRIK